jgi:hypothetical protein
MAEPVFLQHGIFIADRQRISRQIIGVEYSYCHIGVRCDDTLHNTKVITE